MRQAMILMCAVFAASVLATGCGQKPAASAQQAITDSKAKGTVQQQADYLVQQANAFLASKKPEEAMAVANHVLTNLDQNSQAAKQILEKAAAELKQAAGEAKQAAETAVKDIKGQFGVK